MGETMIEPRNIAFACLATAGEAEGQALLLTRSIRAFAGVYASAPVQMFFPTKGAGLSPDTTAELRNLGVQLLPFEIEPEAMAFPFVPKVFAAAAAEKYAVGQTDLLVWLDTDSIVIQEPTDLVIGDNQALGYRPVDHRLIASRYAEPVDNFWQLIYLKCAVPDDQIFPMTTSVDMVMIRPYFNAGMLVLRPEKGVLRQWANTFSNLYRLPIFSTFYRQNTLYQIFFHQAVLAGVILASVEQNTLHSLSHLVNYPLHMHANYPAERRPATMNELVTCRYDTAFQNSDWSRTIAVNEPLKSWLANQA
jgi:hypothetical protein